MDKLPEYPAFKYPHPGPAKISVIRQAAAILLLLASPLGFLVGPPLGIVLLVGGLITFFARTKKLYLGPRYLLCGNTIVYYANVRRLILSEMNGTLTLHATNGKTFTLERDQFPTNARKPDKVKRNKEAKFAKVSAKIIEKVKRHAVAPEMVGLPPEH